MVNGKFVISLDFELMWGVRDKKTIEQYGDNVKGVHQVIPKLLSLFDRYKINATFSTVGFLFFETKKELCENIPGLLPQYSIKELSPYSGYFEQVGDDYKKDIFHFAPQLIREVQKQKRHEIGSHTFSHYYCLEDGQTINAFKEDIKAAIQAAKKYDIKIESLVFPRNQFNDEYLDVCKEFGIICYRGNEHSWLYSAKKGEKDSLIRRGFRFIDAYINISGHNCYAESYLKTKFPVDIPSSRFLRPYSKRLKFLDTFRLRRIKSGMTNAAKRNLVYHLWWHPHNFGINQDENFLFLEKILRHYAGLNSKYSFESITMAELAKNTINDR